MSMESAHRATKKGIITVKENPLDTAAKKYIALFSEKVCSERHRKSRKCKGNTDPVS